MSDQREKCRWDQEEVGHFKTECGADGIRFERGSPDLLLSCPYCDKRIVPGTRNVITFETGGQPK